MGAALMSAALMSAALRGAAPVHFAPPGRGAWRGQSGQAMAEFAIASAVLALLLLGLPAIQRYHQLQFAGIGAARTLAWAGFVPEASGPSAQSGAASLTVGALYAGWLPEGAGAPDASARDTSVRDAAAAQVDGIEPGLSSAQLPGLAGQGTQALLLPFRVLQALGSGSDLGPVGLRTARVTLRVASPDALPAPFAGLALALESQHVVVADGWGASGPRQAAARSAGLVPTNVLAPAKPLLDVGKLLLSVLEPSLRQLCLGQVNPEVVPADRLGSRSDPAALPVATWVPPC